jgi:hypothetical protein
MTLHRFSSKFFHVFMLTASKNVSDKNCISVPFFFRTLIYIRWVGFETFDEFRDRLLVKYGLQLKSDIFWDVAPSGFVYSYQYFWGTCCLHFQGNSTLCMRQHAPPELWYLSTQLHGLTSQKTTVFIGTAVRVSKHTWVMIVRCAPLNLLDSFLFESPVRHLIDMYRVYYSKLILNNNYVLQQRSETVSCSPVLMGSLASFFRDTRVSITLLARLLLSPVGLKLCKYEHFNFPRAERVFILEHYFCRNHLLLFMKDSPTDNEISGYRKCL